MRTKTLLLTAAISAVGVATSMAQAVYSVNAVGYVNVTVNRNTTPGATTTPLMVANPLNTGGNTIAEVIPSAPDFTTFFHFNNGTGNFDNSTTFLFGAWDNPSQAFPPGDAGFLIFDNASIGASVTLTYVGEVPEGTPLSTAVAGGGRASYLSSKAPIPGQLDTDLGFVPADFDTVYRWDKANWTYHSASTWLFGAWDVPPVLGVADGFVLFTDSGTPNRTWTKNFDVTP